MLAFEISVAVVASIGCEGNVAAIGSNGNKIDFSCTWNENRKKERAQPISPKMNRRGVGRRNICSIVGKIDITVVIKASKTVASRENKAFHLMITFVAHQKFATLSSNNPLATGKTLLPTSITDSNPPVP
mmetsp:Transcript_2937/g.3939  ORF Transcript_2937/g.3939 Transcript_2937/m.3939 type:complete len:130 (-) Transcript_2937:156-545(-)